MKFSKAVVLGFVCLGFDAVYAATDMRAVTEDGRKVILTQDGKWRFDSSHSLAVPNADSASPYQTSVKKLKVKFDTVAWIPVPLKEGEAPNKKTFRHASLPLYGVVLADEFPATTEALKGVILSNARSAGATTTVLMDQRRQMGNKSIGFIRFAAILKNVEFVFSTNYYADTDGNIQVMCYTAQSLFHKYQTECQKFIDGLTIN